MHCHWRVLVNWRGFNLGSINYRAFSGKPRIVFEKTNRSINHSRTEMLIGSFLHLWLWKICFSSAMARHNSQPSHSNQRHIRATNGLWLHKQSVHTDAGNWGCICEWILVASHQPFHRYPCSPYWTRRDFKRRNWNTALNLALMKEVMKV